MDRDLLGFAGMSRAFRNRRHAGRVLAEEMRRFAEDSQTVVLALPRGGVPVAFEVAQALSLPLDVLGVRKLGVPGHDELAMGAIATGGTALVDRETVRAFAVSQQDLQAVTRKQQRELARREQLYRGARRALSVTGKRIVVVDDGMATGLTMRVAIDALRQHQPSSIVVAVPVAAREACAELARVADEIVCTLTPEPFHAVAHFYEDFTQTSDEEVRSLLRKAIHEPVAKWRRTGT